MSSDTPEQDQQPTAQELVNQLLEAGYSRTHIANSVGRSPSLISKIRAGIKPARNLAPALQELLTNGTTTIPDRRRRRDGRLAKVRGRAGQPSRTPRTPRGLTRPAPPTPPVVETPDKVEQAPEKLHPAQPPHTQRTPPRRNQIHASEKHLPNGQYTATVRWPPRNIDARDQAADIVTDMIREANQRHDRWQAVVWFEVRDNDGTPRKVHAKLGGHAGYQSGNILGALDDYLDRGQDTLDWLRYQCSERNTVITNSETGSAGNTDIERGTIIAIDIDAW